MNDEMIYRLLRVVHNVYWDGRIPLKIRGCNVCSELVNHFNKMFELPGEFMMETERGHFWFHHEDGRVFKPYGKRWYHANTGAVLDPATLARPND